MFFNLGLFCDIWLTEVNLVGCSAWEVSIAAPITSNLISTWRASSGTIPHTICSGFYVSLTSTGWPCTSLFCSFGSLFPLTKLPSTKENRGEESPSIWCESLKILFRRRSCHSTFVVPLCTSTSKVPIFVWGISYIIFFCTFSNYSCIYKLEAMVCPRWW